MGLAEDDRSFPEEAKLFPTEKEDGESISSEEISFSKEDKEDDCTESQQFLNSIDLVQEDRVEYEETYAGNSLGFSEVHKISVDRLSNCSQN